MPPGAAGVTRSIQRVCVYASSSDAVDPVFAEAARALGHGLAERNQALVYGGGNIGLMGVVAHAVHAGGGHVIGVIPEKLRDMELAYDDADELIITESMGERKAAMETRADAFVALPGGLGTLEEILEVLVLKQLNYHDRPIVFLNTAGVFDHLFRLFNHLCERRFVKASQRALYHVAAEPNEVFRYFENYVPPVPETKLF